MKFILLFLSLIVVYSSSLKINQDEWEFIHTNNSNNISFFVALKQNQNGINELEKTILDKISNIDSPHYGNFLDANIIRDMISPPKKIRSDIIDEFEKNNIFCDDLGDALKCYGSIDDINNFLKVDLISFRNIYSKKIMIVSNKSYIIPKFIEKYVDFIDGISNKLLPTKIYTDKSKNKPNYIIDNEVDQGSVTREVMMRMYNIYPTFVNGNSSVGAMEYQGGEGFSNKNLVWSQIANGVPENPITQNHIIGTVNNPDIESQLDVQVMYWASADAELWYEDFSGWMYGWAVDFFNRTNKPEVVSMSWGWSETDQCSVGNCNGNDSKTYVGRCNIEFMKIVATGTTILASSGDAGSPGRTNEFCYSSEGEYGWNNINAIFPGGSPWVLSVGATYIVKGSGEFDYQTPICKNTSGIKCATGTIERGTTYTKTYWTSGSGFTHWNPSPKWQNNFVNEYLESGVLLPDSKYFNASNRAYPDVSAFGHNCIISNYLGWESVDGTSCSSPIFAGIIANLNAYQKSRNKPILGFVNPLLYKMYNFNKNTFNDVLIGNSTCTEYECCGQQFGFIAFKGWDPVAGLGTPNVEEMKKFLDRNV